VMNDELNTSCLPFIIHHSSLITHHYLVASGGPW
jgi:hypothetical protein